MVTPTMDDGIREMALRCYGYGRWSAPYWFIGPEQGQAPEENDDLEPRVKAWNDLGGTELTDCREFHALIGEQRWHRERPKLQSTWRPLILLLMTFLGKSTVRDTLRNYQRDKWGRLDGETCVIELSGLAARNFTVRRDRESFRQERVTVIRERIVQNSPELVVMYGTSEIEHWKTIAGGSFPNGNVARRGNTIFACTPHPTSYGMKNQYWTSLGSALRRMSVGIG
jgi:hypothetical protein